MTPITLAEWTNPDFGARPVTLPSGAEVVMKLTDLSTHLRYGAIPTQLRAAVMDASRRRHDEARTTEERDDAAREQNDAWIDLLADVIVSPRLSPAELRKVPAADLAMLLQIAHRENVFDALGKPFGVVAVDPFSTFRDEPGSDADRDETDRSGDADSESEPG